MVCFIISFYQILAKTSSHSLSSSLHQTEKLGEKLLPFLKKYRIITLTGDLGSGKTTLAKSLGKALGVKKHLTSPTFTFVNRYPLPHNKSLLHWDFYRLTSPLETEPLGFYEELHNPQHYHLIEWPEIITKYLPLPYLHIHCQDQAKNKLYTWEIKNLKTPTLTETKALWNKWQVPENIRRHMQQVTRVALKIARAKKQNGTKLNLKLIRSAGLLHDLFRVIDFREPTALTLKLRKLFPDTKHESACAEYLKKLNYPEIAQIILEHKFETIIDPTSLPFTTEGKILYYADKRVKHDEIVSLKERLTDGRIRNHHLLDPNTDLIEHECFRLEKEIFAHLSLRPEDIK